MVIYAGTSGFNIRYPRSPCYEKIMTNSDLGTTRLYLSTKFAAYLKPFGHDSVWKITGPLSSIIQVKEEGQAYLEVNLHTRPAHTVGDQEILIYT
ncbi:hypothetical protein AHAS_Ahas03G0117300 [Arachis hypogaea]